MMRKVIAASIALSPFMLHAQANSPAQPQATGNVPVVKSKLNQPQFFAAMGADTVVTKSSPLRVSTGVTNPKLIHFVGVTADPTAATWCLQGNNCRFVVSMIVDKTGKPSDLKVVQSSGRYMEQSVLTAVGQYRFSPGTVSNQPVPSPMNLEVVIVRPGQ